MVSEMNRTPKSKNSKLQCRIKQDKIDEVFTSAQSETITSSACSTPIARRSLNIISTDDECVSPIHIRCTQDGGDDELDVVWDWNSPQSKMNKNFSKQRKRALNNISPKIPKKLPTKNLPRFTLLQAELEILASKICQRQDDDVIPESCLVINLPEKQPITNNFYNVDIDKSEKLNIVYKPLILPQESNNNLEDLSSSDLFGDDSLDEEMIKCSQQVEEAFNKPQLKSLANVNLLLNSCNDTIIADDSFDAVLEDFTDADIALLSQTSGNVFAIETITSVKPVAIETINTVEPVATETINRKQQSNLDKLIVSRTIVRANSTPTQSFRPSVVLPRTKSAQDCDQSMFREENEFSCSSTVTCSPEEIEKKRLEARARLELKKKQNEIEKNRQQALERLKRNRMQRMLIKQNKNTNTKT